MPNLHIYLNIKYKNTKTNLKISILTE